MADEGWESRKRHLEIGFAEWSAFAGGKGKAKGWERGTKSRKLRGRRIFLYYITRDRWYAKPML
jgi:hypothetical protein